MDFKRCQPKNFMIWKMIKSLLLLVAISLYLVFIEGWDAYLAFLTVPTIGLIFTLIAPPLANFMSGRPD